MIITANLRVLYVIAKFSVNLHKIDLVLFAGRKEPKNHKALRKSYRRRFAALTEARDALPHWQKLSSDGELWWLA